MDYLQFPLKNKYQLAYKHGSKTFYSNFHKGYDIIPLPTAVGEPIYAPLSGKVTKVAFAYNEGRELAIEGNFRGKKMRSYMAHLQRCAAGIYRGATVKKGQLIGYVGNTGKLTTGAHLHWHCHLDGKLIDQWPLIQIFNKSFAKKHEGKIFLQVDRNGEAWYIYKGYRYFLGSPSQAFKIMSQLGVGITTTDLEKIPIGVLKKL